MPSVDQTLRVRLDKERNPTLTGPKPLHFITSEDIVLDLYIEAIKTDLNGPTTTPPTYEYYDITSWTGTMRIKANIEDTAVLHTASLVLAADPHNGHGSFTIVAASNTTLVDHGVGVMEFASDGTNIDLKVPFSINIAPSMTYYT